MNISMPAGFINGLKKVRLSVSFNEKMDETTELCQFSLPSGHYLESWGDTEPKAGYISFIQPTIAPLFKTRPFQTALLRWSGNNTDYDTWFRQYWSTRLGGTPALKKRCRTAYWKATGEEVCTTPTT
jgi:molybdopterin-containing oxidoreductase family iron-sulfur binding subunit